MEQLIIQTYRRARGNRGADVELGVDEEGEGGAEEEEGEPELLRKYRRFLQNRALERDPTVKWCPTPGCETAIK